MENNRPSPNSLLDHMQRVLKVPNDAGLCRIWDVKPPTISKIRQQRARISSALLIIMHETTKIPLRDLRFMMGDYREHTGPSATIVPLHDRKVTIPLQLS